MGRHQEPRLPLDEARLLPRARSGEVTGDAVDRYRMQRAQARALMDALVDAPPDAMLPQRATKAEPGDLRGIPAIGPGVTGAITGTSPERETLRRLSRGR